MYVLILLCVSLSAKALAEPAEYYDLNNAAQYFEQFIKIYDKHYTAEERELRFEIFRVNLAEMNLLNEKDDGTIHGINQFTDLTLEEFIKSHTGYRRSGAQSWDTLCDIYGDPNIPDIEVPESFDWREHDAVTPVKNQLLCGSCWAFATAAYLESQYAIKYKKQIDLSEQQIIDCDINSDGCKGGLSAFALPTIQKIGGLMLEEDYEPYCMCKHNKCLIDKSKAVVKVANCSSYKISSQKKVQQLLYQTGPIAIAIKASALHKHQRGIVSDEKCNVGEINHEVLLVGYGIENNKPYWIVKNSWGYSSNQEDGYFKMERSYNIEGACAMLQSYLQTAVIE